MKAFFFFFFFFFFVAVTGKNGYEKLEVNKPGEFFRLFYVQSRAIPKHPVAGVSRKQSSYSSLLLYINMSSSSKELTIFASKRCTDEMESPWLVLHHVDVNSTLSMCPCPSF